MHLCSGCSLTFETTMNKQEEVNGAELLNVAYTTPSAISWKFSQIGSRSGGRITVTEGLEQSEVRSTTSTANTSARLSYFTLIRLTTYAKQESLFFRGSFQHWPSEWILLLPKCC